MLNFIENLDKLKIIWYNKRGFKNTACKELNSLAPMGFIFVIW
jgi:hypothetical protein